MFLAIWNAQKFNCGLGFNYCQFLKNGILEKCLKMLKNAHIHRSKSDFFKENILFNFYREFHMLNIHFCLYVCFYFRVFQQHMSFKAARSPLRITAYRRLLQLYHKLCMDFKITRMTTSIKQSSEIEEQTKLITCRMTELNKQNINVYCIM